MTDTDTQLVKGTTTILVLSALAEEPMHGYRLVRSLERRCGGHLSFREGTIYPLLYTLEDRGLIASRISTGRNGRERKEYRITDAGTSVLRKRLADWKSLVAGMQLALGDT